MNFGYEIKQIREGIGSELFNKFSNIDCFLAGGAMVSIYNNRPVEDYDIYTKSAKDAFKVIFSLENQKFVCVAKTNRSALFCKGTEENKILVNVIYFNYFNNLKEVFDLFDFTVCMGGYDFKNKTFDFHPAFFRDNLIKKLFYSNNSRYPIGALIRIGKYKNKGFNISKKELIKIILHCQKLEINNMDDLEDQVGTIYGCNLKEIIGEEFDLNTIINKLDKIEDQEFIPNKKVNIDIDWEEVFQPEFDIILCPCNKKYKMLDELFIRESQNNKVTKELQFPFYVYKYVKKTDDKNIFQSFIKPSFKYIIGKRFVDANKQVFCGIYDKHTSFTYYNNPNSVLIKIQVDKPEDFTRFNPYASRGTTISTGTVIEVVS